VMARKGSLGLLIAATTAAALTDQPQIGRPADPPSAYEMGNARTFPLALLCLSVVCHHTSVPCAVFVSCAVLRYLGGMSAREAIEGTRAACSERNIQNLARRSGRPRVFPTAPPEATAKPAKKLLKRRSLNRHADQTEKLAMDLQELECAHIQVHKEASLQLEASQKARELAGGACGANKGANTITKEINAPLPSDVKPVAGSIVKRDVLLGRAGMSPQKSGRKGGTPTEAANAAHSWVSVSQQTAVPKPKDVGRVMKAAVQWTAHEDLLLPVGPLRGLEWLLVAEPIWARIGDKRTKDRNGR